jgi:hypothetical protein
MKELMENGAKIADAIQVLVNAKLLTFKKTEVEDAEATLKLHLREADHVGDTDDEVGTEEPVIVLATLRFDEAEQAEMGTDIIYYTAKDAHPFTALHNTTVYGANKGAAV